MNYARRLLPFSVDNLRELGGYPTKDGKCTKYGSFLRSSLIIGLSEQDKKLLYDYGVRYCVDLRSDYELERFPSSLVGDRQIEYHHISFIDAYSIYDSYNFSEAEHYVPIIRETAKLNVGKLFRLFASFDEGAVIFNCTAGKDRTGLTAAFLLMLAGCFDEDIVADYEITNTYIRAKIGAGVPEEVSYSKPEWMRSTIAFIDSCGGITKYLSDCGVSEKEIEAVKSRIV